MLAILIAVGAWVNMKALGESIAEMGASMKTAAAGGSRGGEVAPTDETLHAAPAPHRRRPLLPPAAARRLRLPRAGASARPGRAAPPPPDAADAASDNPPPTPPDRCETPAPARGSRRSLRDTPLHLPA